MDPLHLRVLGPWCSRKKICMFVGMYKSSHTTRYFKRSPSDHNPTDSVVRWGKLSTQSCACCGSSNLFPLSFRQQRPHLCLRTTWEILLVADQHMHFHLSLWTSTRFYELGSTHMSWAVANITAWNVPDDIVFVDFEEADSYVNHIIMLTRIRTCRIRSDTAFRTAGFHDSRSCRTYSGVIDSSIFTQRQSSHANHTILR